MLTERSSVSDFGLNDDQVSALARALNVPVSRHDDVADVLERMP